MKHIVTADDLRKLGACSSQYRKFKKVFPEGARINLESFRIAIDNDLDIGWLFCEGVDDEGKDNVNSLLSTLRPKFCAKEMSVEDFVHEWNKSRLQQLRTHFTLKD